MKSLNYYFCVSPDQYVLLIAGYAMDHANSDPCLTRVYIQAGSNRILGKYALPKTTDLHTMKEIFPHYRIGHFIGEPDNPTEFELSRFEEMGELDIDDPHKHNFYEIIWVDEGLSTQIIDYREYTLEPGSLFFISPNQLHHFEEYQPLRGGSVFFTEDFFRLNSQDRERLFEMTFLDNFYSQPFLRPEVETFAEIRQTIEQLFNEKQRTDASPAILQSLLTILLARIQRAVDTESVQRAAAGYVVLYKNLNRLIDRHFREPFTVRDYAERLAVTPNHLNRVARQVMGRTTTQLIQARNTLEAKRLLTFTDTTVSEIAATLGYFDLSYFARVFRADAGLSPLKFRKAMSEKYRKGSQSF